MANALANFGLGLQGMDAGRQADQTLEAQRQNIEAQKRANLLRDQQIKAGNMGLEDVSRQRSNLAAERAAVSGATDMDSTYSAVAGARRAAGNLSGVEDATAKQKANVTNALMRLAQQAQMGADPKQAEAELKQSGIGRDITPGTLTWGFDPNTKEHMIMYVDTNGKKQAQSATAIIRANSKQDVKTIPAGGSALITQPGAAPQMLTAPQKAPDHALNSNFVTRKNEDGSETLIDLRDKQPVSGGETSGPNVRKDLSVLNDITKGITELGEEYGKTDMSNLQITLTPKGQQTALIAEQIRMANPKLAPRTIIDMATKGKPMWKVENGSRTGVVLYNGQEFPMNTPRGGAPVAAPTAKPPVAGARQAADGKWYVPDSNRPGKFAEVVSGAQPTPAAKVTRPDADIPEVVVPVARQTAKSRHAQVMETARAEQENRARLRPVEAFRFILEFGRMTFDDAAIIEDAIAAKDTTGKTLLTPVELAKAKRMLAKLRPQTAGYRRGGRITRQQAYGL